ncbi:MAG: hypothetical protein Q9211_005591 [Gyalolechia sp. 1 TL-2023]
MSRQSDDTGAVLQHETPSHRPRNDYIATAIPTNPITPAAAAAKGTLDAAANPVDDEAGTPLVPVIPVASALLVVAPLPAIVPFPLMTTDVLPFTTVANRLVVNVLPILVIVLTNVAFPVPLFNNVLVGFTVAALASLLIMLNVDSTTLSRPWYSVGRAVRNGGGVSAVSAEETMEFMFPVMEAEEAADSIATARPGRMDWGKYWDIIWAAAEERAGAEVLWSKERELVLDERGGNKGLGLQCRAIEGWNLAREEVGSCVCEDDEREKVEEMHVFWRLDLDAQD